MKPMTAQRVDLQTPRPSRWQWTAIAVRGDSIVTT